MSETEQSPPRLTIPCPECGARITPGAGGKILCDGCGFTTAKDEAKDDRDDLRVVEIFPLEDARVVLCLRSGVQVAYRVSRASLVADGQAETPDVCSRRLKVLPRTDGKWIVFDNLQPMARGDVQVCRSMHAACVALGEWVERERAPGGIPLRAPVPTPPMPPRPRTMTEVAKITAPRLAALKSAGATKSKPQPDQTLKRGRKWPGCAHRRYAGETSCRFCVAQVAIPGTEGKPSPA